MDARSRRTHARTHAQMAVKGAEALEVATKAELPMLSDEDICLILSLMPIDNLPACAAICKHWAAVLRGDGLLWSNIFTHRFGGTVEPTAARHACNRCMSTIRALAMTTESCRGMRKTAHHLRPLSRRAGAAAGQLGPLIVISGGATDHFHLTSHVDVCLFASDRNGRELVAPAVHPLGDQMPERWQHSAVSWREELWLYGGQDRGRGHPCGLLHVLALGENSPSAQRASLGEENMLWPPQIKSRAVGLVRCKDDELQSSVELPVLYFPGEGPALTGHTARLVEDGNFNLAYMLSFGGKAAGGTVTNLLWRINLTWAHPMDALYDECGHQFLEWRLLLATGRTPSPRYCHSAVELSRGCMIFGGWAQGRDPGATQLNQGTVFLSDLHVLELPSMSWVAPDVSGSVPRGRCQSVMVAAPDEELVLVFGGACHHDPKPGQAYGDMVLDLFDVVLLHVPTMTWLPQKGLPSNYQQRGGTNTLIRTVDGRCFVFGGMNSDEGCNEPNFLNDLTELVGL